MLISTKNQDLITADFLVNCDSDTIGDGQKSHYKQGVTATSHIYCKVDPLKTKESITVAIVCQCKRCHCTRGGLYRVTKQLGHNLPLTLM